MRRDFIATLVVLLAPCFLCAVFAQSPSSVSVLVIAHGAGETWNAPVVSAVDQPRRTTPAAVGFLMGKGPLPQQAYDDLVRQGASRIVDRMMMTKPRSRQP